MSKEVHDWRRLSLLPLALLGTLALERRKHRSLLFVLLSVIPRLIAIGSICMSS